MAKGTLIAAAALLVAASIVGYSRVADAASDDVPVVDVMMLYTPRAGQGAGGEAGVRGIAERAAASANRAFTNSEARVRTRIVAVRPAPDYHPPEGREDGYGYLFHKPASVGRLREEVRADVVGLFAADTGGFSNGVPRPVPATSPGAGAMMLLGYDRADEDPDLYFTHELGHLLGLAHDGDDFDDGYTYARGYIPPSMAWRDIMAYESHCGGHSCPLVPYFSNPRLTYQGEALGVPRGQPGEADAVHMLDLSAPVVAGYR